MSVREPAVAGQFYPDSREECQEEVASCLAGIGKRTVTAGQAVGGIVPHAGWVFSGTVAAGVISVLAERPGIETFVVFGAMHRYLSRAAGAVYTRGAWETPLGQISIDEELAEAVIRGSSILAADPDSHELEHSIEVQVPFIQRLAPEAKLLPVVVPPSASAPAVGEALALQTQALGRKAVFVGSTDLTHYGPRYRFTPMGSGADALRWAKEVNDRRMLDLVEAMTPDKIVPEAVEHHNACGSGAVAAAMRACQVLGADRAQILRHTTSNEVGRRRFGESADAVGYAGVVFIKSGEDN